MINWFNERKRWIDCLRMDMKENGEFADERPPSPMWVLQHFSEEAFRVAGEALNSVYQGGTGIQEMGTGHRRARSEVPSPVHNRTNGFQRLKSHVQKVWGWGRGTRDEDYAFCSFDPEILANQKRQWYQFHSKSLVSNWFYVSIFFLQPGFFRVSKKKKSWICCFLKQKRRSCLWMNVLLTRSSGLWAMLYYTDAIPCLISETRLPLDWSFSMLSNISHLHRPCISL